jgi:hypothetical protein
MQGIGGFIVLLGAGSFVLHFMDMEFTLLSWVDRWGATAGIAIRIGLIFVGAVLWFIGRQQEAKADSPPAT